MLGNILAVAGLVLTAVGVAAALFPEEAREITVRLFGGTARRKGRISGRWKGVYRIPRGRDEGYYSEELEVRQLGRNVVVRVVGKPMLRARGTVRQDRYLTGEWFHAMDGSVYHGGFQMIIDPKGDVVSGKWIGYSHDRAAIQSDTWVWTRN